MNGAKPMMNSGNMLSKSTDYIAQPIGEPKDSRKQPSLEEKLISVHKLVELSSHTIGNIANNVETLRDFYIKLHGKLDMGDVHNIDGVLRGNTDIAPGLTNFVDLIYNTLQEKLKTLSILEEQNRYLLNQLVIHTLG